jgi:hypothetical protein
MADFQQDAGPRGPAYATSTIRSNREVAGTAGGRRQADSFCSNDPTRPECGSIGKRKDAFERLRIARLRDQCRIARPAPEIVDFAKRAFAGRNPIRGASNLRHVHQRLRLLLL